MDKVEMVSKYLNMTSEQAKDVCDFFEKIRDEKIDKMSKYIRKPILEQPGDYVDYWENYWYRAMNFDELVKSEVEQGGWDGDKNTWHERALEFCESEMNNTIFKLPCGMYAQYVG